MLSQKYRMYAITFFAVALIAAVFIIFEGGVIRRSLSEHLLPLSLSAPSSITVQEHDVSRALVTLKVPQPAPNFVLTSERFVKNTNKPIVKSQDGN